MKNIFRLSRSSWLIIISLFFSAGIVLAADYNNFGYRVDTGSVIGVALPGPSGNAVGSVFPNIEEHSQCRTVSNSTGQNVFIPTKSGSEWQRLWDPTSRSQNLPNGLSFNTCVNGCFYGSGAYSTTYGAENITEQNLKNTVINRINAPAFNWPSAVKTSANTAINTVVLSGTSAYQEGTITVDSIVWKIFISYDFYPAEYDDGGRRLISPAYSYRELGIAEQAANSGGSCPTVCNNLPGGPYYSVPFDKILASDGTSCINPPTVCPNGGTFPNCQCAPGQFRDSSGVCQDAPECTITPTTGGSAYNWYVTICNASSCHRWLTGGNTPLSQPNCP